MCPLCFCKTRWGSRLADGWMKTSWRFGLCFKGASDQMYLLSKTGISIYRQRMEQVVNFTRTTSHRISSIQNAGPSFIASNSGKNLMWLFLAVVAFCSSLGSLRAEEEEAAVFFKFYSFYQSKWQIEEEKEGKKETYTAECYGSAGGCNIYVGKGETSVWGYNPKTRQWTGVGQLDKGSRYVMAISRPAGPKFKPGMVFTFTGTIWHADGQINYVTGKQTCVDANTLRDVVTGTDQDGKAIPKVVKTYKRIK